MDAHISQVNAGDEELNMEWEELNSTKMIVTEQKWKDLTQEFYRNTFKFRTTSWCPCSAEGEPIKSV